MVCEGTKTVVFCGAEPTCATAGTAIPNTIASIAASSTNFLFNFFPPPFSQQSMRTTVIYSYLSRNL
jgi:hypothetical protein